MSLSITVENDLCGEEDFMCLVGITSDVVAQWTWKANILYGSFPNSFPIIKIFDLC